MGAAAETGGEGREDHMHINKTTHRAFQTAFSLDWT